MESAKSQNEQEFIPVGYWPLASDSPPQCSCQDGRGFSGALHSESSSRKEITNPKP